MASLPALIAPGGQLTVLRRLAGFTWGSWTVEWPDDFEPPELEEGHSLGYVGVLREANPGRSARRFTREDVSIVAANDEVVPREPGMSNVEEIFNETAQRLSGDTFFERDISTDGLGVLVPYRDFNVGDRVPVRLWNRVLTGQLVTSVTQSSSVDEPLGWRVHIGGQVVGDHAQRQRQNREVERAIAQERRERVADVAHEGSKRRAAITAEAQARAADITEIRSEVSQELIAATEATNEAIAGVQVTAEAAKNWTEENQQAFNLATSLAFSAQQQTNDFNAIQWLKQDAWNKTQEEINETQAKLNEAQAQWNRDSEQLNAQQNAEIKRLDEVKQEQQHLINMMARPLAATSPTYRTDIETIREFDEDDFGRLQVTASKVVFTAKGSWTGSVYVLMQIEALNNYSILISQRVTRPGQTVSVANGIFQSISSAIAVYKAIA